MKSSQIPTKLTRIKLSTPCTCLRIIDFKGKVYRFWNCLIKKNKKDLCRYNSIELTRENLISKDVSFFADITKIENG